MMLVIRHAFVRRTISILTAMIAAFIVNYYLSMTQYYLIPVTTLFVMLTSVGNPVYQGVKRFLWVVIIVVVLSYVLPPHKMLYERIYDVSLGAMIGIFANLVILPRRADSEFRVAMVPVLKAYRDFFNAIVDQVFDEGKNSEDAQIKVEYQLQKLPAWVHERGFDSGLKKGYQYFLIKIELIAKILFAMHHAARNSFDTETRTTMRKSFYVCADKINEFFNALITVFELKTLKEGVDDFEPQLHDLDSQFQALLPINLELSDMSNESVCFYELIYGLNDLRSALVKLGQALR